MRKVPVISFVAPRSGSGKTTLISQVVGRLSALNVKVAVLKHSHACDVDDSKDTWRFREAGASGSAVLTDSNLLAVYLPDSTLDDAIRLLEGTGCEIILCEGFRRSPIPKIILAGTQYDYDALSSLENVVAVVSGEEIRAGAGAETGAGARVPLLRDSGDVARFILELVREAAPDD